MFGHQTVLHTLAPASHVGREKRLSAADLLRFEDVLEATDTAVATCMAARARAESNLDEVRDGGSESTEVLNATLEAIVACTGARQPVSEGALTRAEAVEWTIQAITKMRDNAVHDATAHNLAPGIRPDHLANCMHLIVALQAQLGGAQ